MSNNIKTSLLTPEERESAKKLADKWFHACAKHYGMVYTPKKSTIKEPDMYADNQEPEEKVIKDIDFDDSMWYNIGSKHGK